MAEEFKGFKIKRAKDFTISVRDAMDAGAIVETKEAYDTQYGEYRYAQFKYCFGNNVIPQIVQCNFGTNVPHTLAECYKKDCIIIKHKKDNEDHYLIINNNKNLVVAAAPDPGDGE